MIEASISVTIEVESQSHTSSQRLRRCTLVVGDCVRTIVTTFYHMHRIKLCSTLTIHCAATGDMVKCFIISLVAIYFSETSNICPVRVSNREIWHRHTVAEYGK